MNILKKISIFLPILSIELQIPFITIRTVIMRECDNKHEVEYIVLEIRIWRWFFNIRLYDTYRRMNMRIIEKQNREIIIDNIEKNEGTKKVIETIKSI